MIVWVVRWKLKPTFESKQPEPAHFMQQVDNPRRFSVIVSVETSQHSKVAGCLSL